MCHIVFCNAVFSQSTSKICTLIRFTLFSNLWIFAWQDFPVLLPYRFTLFSNHSMWRKHTLLVLLPYRFTLFSNPVRNDISFISFYYLIDLHYSQTAGHKYLISLKFYYLIDLHYSRTRSNHMRPEHSFTTL